MNMDDYVVAFTNKNNHHFIFFNISQLIGYQFYPTPSYHSYMSF